MKFRKNVPMMKAKFTEAFKSVDKAGSETIERLNLDLWQSPAIMCSKLATSALLSVHPSTAYDEARQIITAFVGPIRSVKWVSENVGKTLVAHVGTNVQFEVKIKEGKRKQMLVRFAPVITNIAADSYAVEVFRRNGIVAKAK